MDGTHNKGNKPILLQSVRTVRGGTAISADLGRTRTITRRPRRQGSKLRPIRRRAFA